MFFCFTVGVQDFSSPADKQLPVLCNGCRNPSAYVMNRRKFITFCFVPLIPVQWKKEFWCRSCNYRQRTSSSEIKAMESRGPLQQGPPHHQQTGGVHQKNIQQDGGGGGGGGGMGLQHVPASYQKSSPPPQYS